VSAFLDAVTLASAQDLIRRLRLAGDAHPDLRCLLTHKIRVPHSIIYDTYGGVFGEWSFSPLYHVRDWWELLFYLESLHDSAALFSLGGRADERWMEREQMLQDTWRSSRTIVTALFDDAAWLLYFLDPTRIPGISEIDTTKLIYGPTTWIWLLFHACWARPNGTILRAGRWYPKQWMTRVRLHERQAKLAGFEKPNGTLEYEAAVKKAIAERQKTLTRNERTNEWRAAATEISAQAKARLEQGEYISRLPCDPFTASAALLEFLILKDDAPADSEGTNCRPALTHEEWSIPMSKTAMARKLKDDKHARPRDVESLLAQYGVKQIGPRQFEIRLDQMDVHTRRRFDSSERRSVDNG